jgi:hypothetical protein
LSLLLFIYLFTNLKTFIRWIININLLPLFKTNVSLPFQVRFW